MINLYLIRHGQSEVNARPDEIGQSSNVILTDLGKDQSHKLGNRLKKDNIIFDYIYSSPYIRALNTAQIVCQEQSNMIEVVSELREYSAGDWTGKSRSQTISNDVRLRMAQLGNGFLPPNGESLHMVERRASQWLEDKIIYNYDLFKTHTNIGIFSHGMTIKCLLHYIMGFDQAFTWKIALENTSITNLVFDNTGWRLITINDFAHLR